LLNLIVAFDFMRHLYCIIFLSLCFAQVHAQNADSLESRLDQVEGKEKAIVLNELYKLYLNNNPIKALSYTRQALTLSEKIDDPSGMASSYNNMGVIYKNQGSLDKALQSYISALRIQEDNKFVDAIAYTYSNIGTVYSLKGEYDKALEYFNQANDQFKSINHDLRIIGSLNNIGNVYEAKGEYAKALEYYLESLKYYEELGDNSQAFVPFNNIGNIYYMRGNIASAMAYYQSALDLERFNNDKNGETNALHNIGSAFKKQNKLDTALSYFNEALNIAQETDNKRLLSIIYRSLAETYFAKEDMLMAYSFLSLHTTANESFYNMESNKQIADLENALELEKKEAEIRELTVTNDLQQLQLKNDRIIIISGILLSIIGVGLTIIIYRENKVIRRNKMQLERQKNELESKNLIIEEKNSNITESIAYAKSVQKSLQNYKISDDKKERSFIFHKPKDIVSGDFYWYTEKDDKVIIVAADCTGHGVAGAFMTIVGITGLEGIVNRNHIFSPSKILSKLNEQVETSLSQSGKDISDHSMDLAVCCIDYKSEVLKFAGANRPLYYVKNGALEQIKGSKINIGDRGNDKLTFAEHEIGFSEADMVYMFSDGYVDQFGGGFDKKFMPKRLRNLLKKIASEPLNNQRELVAREFESWKDGKEQTDDVLLMGFRI